MKNKIFALGTAFLMLTVWSCRQESDTLMSYDQNESLVFENAKTSFAAKFQVLWNGMNQYYALWDYEKEQGLDWDDVYDEYYPQFVALDKKNTVTDDELQALMSKVFDPLHDGHLSFSMTNHTTGSTVTYLPSVGQLLSRDDFEASQIPVSLGYYANVANGEIETDGSGNPIAMEHFTDLSSLIMAFATTPGYGLMWIKDRKAELEALSEPTEMQSFELEQLGNLLEDLHQINNKTITDAVTYWNNLQMKYSFLNVPGFNPIDQNFAESSVNVKFALFKGNIAYFFLDKFVLSKYFDDEKAQETFDMTNPDTYKQVQAVKQVWQAWFDTVQQLHKDGTLGGVIIDLRSNGGGMMDDSQYLVGALLPAGGIHFGYQRFKRGTGRYEYSPLMPAYVKSMSEPHENITEPVVILGNCQSASMSETSILCVKTLPNGTFIGKRSFGAICALIENDFHSFNYAGYIGVEGVTAVFGKVPTMASYTLDKKLIESQGITPDIEVDLDVSLFGTTGQDTQLDRALQFIRTGN